MKSADVIGTRTTTSSRSRDDKNSALSRRSSGHREEDEHRIISAVKRGLKKSRSKSRKENRSWSGNPNLFESQSRRARQPQAQPASPSPSTTALATHDFTKTHSNRNSNSNSNNVSNNISNNVSNKNSSSRKSNGTHVHASSKRGKRPTTSRNAYAYAYASPSVHSEMEMETEIALVSDDDDEKRTETATETETEADSDAGFHGFLHRLVFDESITTASVEDQYNYIDDVSYGGSENESQSENESENENESSSSSSASTSSSASSSASSSSSLNHMLGDLDAIPSDQDSYRNRNDTSYASSSNYTSSSGEIEAATEVTYNHYDDDNDNEQRGRRYSNRGFESSSRAGREVVALLLSSDRSGVATLDAQALATVPMTIEQARTVVQPIAEAIARSTSLHTLVFTGPWNFNDCNNTGNNAGSKQRPQPQPQPQIHTHTHARTLESRAEMLGTILSDGLLPNTSVRTLVLEGNYSFDRYAGSIFGNLLRLHPRIRRLELRNCWWQCQSPSHTNSNSNSNSNSEATSNHQHSNGSSSSGWNALLLGLQHSKSVKELSLENLPPNGLSDSDLDGISLTMGYLRLESLRLVGVGLQTIHPESLVVFFRAIQETPSIKDLDLSKNVLEGRSSHSLFLLSRCLSGATVDLFQCHRHGHDRHQTYATRSAFAYHRDDCFEVHHIERLILVDCGITRTSDLKTLTSALSSTSGNTSSKSKSKHPTQAEKNPNRLNDATITSSLDVSGNRFGNAGAKVLHEWISAHPNVKALGMLSCNVSAKHLKIVSDRLRYNNSFLQAIGLGSEMSLAILDSVSTMENVLGGVVGSGGTSTVGGATPT